MNVSLNGNTDEYLCQELPLFLFWMHYSLYIHPLPSQVSCASLADSLLKPDKGEGGATLKS